MTIRALFFLALTFFLSVGTAYAAPGDISCGTTLSACLTSIKDFILAVLVPLVFAVAFLVFIWGMFQYFIAGGANEEKREEGKKLAIWGIVAFFVMVSVWGLVNIIGGTFMLNTTPPPLPKFPGVSP